MAVIYLAFDVAVDTNLDGLISSDLPFRERQHALDEAFPMLGHRIVAVIEGGTLDARLAAAQALEEALARQPELIDSVFAPAIMPFFERHALLFDDVATVEAQLDRLARAQPFLARLAADARPTGLVALLAEGLERGNEDLAFEAALDALLPALSAAGDGRAEAVSWLELAAGGTGAAPILIEVRPRLDFTRLQPAAAALRAVRAAAAEAAAGDAGVRIALTGPVPLEAEELEAAGAGASSAGLASLALVAIVLAMGIRCAGTVAAVVLTLMVGLAATAALGLALVGTFTMISIAFAVLFIGLGVDFAIHLVLRAQELTADGRPWPRAIEDAATDTGPALVLCALTTAAAFLAFAATDYVGLAQLGIIAAVGMVVALVASLTLLPALLVLIGRPRALARLPVMPRSSTRTASLALIALAVLLVPAAAGVRFDGDPLGLKDQGAPSVLAFRTLLADAERSPYYAELLADDADEAQAMTARLEASDAVGGVRSLVDFVPEDQTTKLALIADARLFLVVPEASPPPPADAAALTGALERLAAVAPNDAWADAVTRLQAALTTTPALAGALQEAWFRHWPQALDRMGALLDAGPVEAGDLPPSLAARYVTDDGRMRLEILPATPLLDTEARSGFARAVVELTPQAAGNVVQIKGAADIVSRAMVEATLTALAAVALLVALVLRRTRDVMAVLAAVLIAGVLTLGLMWLLGLSFNFANVIVLPLLLGFGVDAAIHMIVRARATGDTLSRTSTPRAVVLSALTTLGSFGTLALSPHEGTASMGMVLALALVMNVTAVLIALPAMVRARA